MSEAPLTDSDLDRRVMLRVVATGCIFLVVVAFVNASTLATDAARQGRAIDAWEPWLLEYSSVAVMAALLPLVALVERRFPIEPAGWLRALAVHAAASVGFSLLHVAGMTLLRKAAYALFVGQPYSFLDDPLTDLVYEYRKDALTYALFILVLTLVRGMEERRRDAAAARMEAGQTGRLTLKSGGRTMMVDAASIEWAQAAGNYVEIRAGARTLLARMTLAALEEQLAAAGVAVARVHRSTLVNRARVAEIAPLRDGDFRIRTSDGSELRGSRRYRDSLPG